MGRASRIPIGSTSQATASSGGGSSLRACLLLAVSSFCCELYWVAQDADPLGPARIRGLLAGLALGLSLAALLGFGVGAVARLARLRSGVAGERSSLHELLWGGDEAQRRARVGALIGGLGLLCMLLLAAFFTTRALIIGMAQPHFAAAAVVGAHLAFLVLGALLFPFAHALADPLAGLGATRWLRWALGRPGNTVVVLAVFGIVAGIAAAVLFWDTVQFLPFRTLAATAGALGVVLVLRLSERVLARGTVAFEHGLLALAIVSAGGSLIAFAGQGPETRALRQTAIGALGERALMLAFDFDGDGSLSFMGGGDCAPFDAASNPRAIDLPNDRVDQDCDGVDLDDKLLGPAPRRDWPVPRGFPKRPAVFLLTIDAFAAKHTGAFNYPRHVTPELDRFALGAAFFRYAFAQGPSTRLSFPSMFTSRYDTQIVQRLVGSHPYPIDASEVMLAEVLNGEGYDTQAVISDSYFRASRWGSLTAGFNKVTDASLRATGKHNSPAVSDAAIGLIDKPRTKPLFMWAHYYDAHSPHVQPEGVTRYGTERDAVYDAELNLVDREVGRLLAHIEQTYRGQALIFITGDHGIAFDKGRHGKFNYGYDLSTVVLHVPLIVRGPLIRPQVTDRIASTMDIAPTITNLLKIKKRLPFEGASLAPELFEAKATRPQLLLHEFFLQERLWEDKEPLEQISVRSDRFNLVHDRKNGGYQLYDWAADYEEQHDLSASPAYARDLAALRQQLALLTYRTYIKARPPAAPAARAPAPALPQRAKK